MLRLLPIIVIVIVAIGILTGLSKQIISALNASERLNVETEKVTQLAEENKKLKEELIQAESSDELEETMRNELNMGKKDETVVMIPQNVIDQVIESQKPIPPAPKEPNWQGWLKLFVH